MERAEELFNRIITGGESTIEEFILTRESEHLFLDFKRSADNGASRVLHQNDRHNLAKAISGFGNSEGGILIWGIDCSSVSDYSDLPNAKFPIQNVTRFVSWLEGAVSGCTVPPHIGVKNHPISLNSNGDGYVVTFIPKSVHSPHQVVIGKQYYYIRAGSNFVPTPHSVLAGMFGRRPQPHVFNQFTFTPANLVDNLVSFELGFVIANNGPGIASDLFMNVAILSSPGPNCTLGIHLTDPKWAGFKMFGFRWSIISPPDLRLPPETQTQPLVLSLALSPPFERKLLIDGICGCAQSPSYKFQVENNRDSIESAYSELIYMSSVVELSLEQGHEYARRFLGQENHE